MNVLIGKVDEQLLTSFMLSKFMLLASWAFLLKFVCPSTWHCQDGYDDHRNHDGDHRYNHDSHDVWLASLFPP